LTATTLANGERRLLWTTFTPQQVDIDVLHPQGQAYLQAILKLLSASGVKMIRLDAVGYAIKKAGGYVIKLLRGEGLEGAAGQHKSETELQGIPLESFDFIIDNREWTLNQLELYLHQLVQLHQGK
jgi:glycosidase